MRRIRKSPELRALEGIRAEAADAQKRLRLIEQSLDRFERHELFERRSHWRSFVYQVLLGSAFAVGTILGLVLMSWLTYTYFRDTEVLREVIDRQMRLRYFDLDQLRSGATEGLRFGDLFRSAPQPHASGSGSETVRDSAGGVR